MQSPTTVNSTMPTAMRERVHIGFSGGGELVSMPSTSTVHVPDRVRPRAAGRTGTAVSSTLKHTGGSAPPSATRAPAGGSPCWPIPDATTGPGGVPRSLPPVPALIAGIGGTGAPSQADTGSRWQAEREAKQRHRLHVRFA